ncbi:NAD-dependent epimerase/dehydratase family protein [Streptomyces lasalocidi]
MRILVIGGSVFLGRAFVADAFERGHAVTVFNRGRSGPDLPGIPGIRGDREDPDDLSALAGQGPWDAVIDTSGQHPRTVGLSARALSGHADAYLFVSSFHAYADWPAGPVDEDSPRHPCAPDAAVDDVPANALKAGCERAVEAEFEGRTVILNPGLVIGPRETPGRLLWWLERMARGGEVLAPAGPDRPVQLIDARDVAAFGIRLLETGDEGRYLVAGPQGTETLGTLLDTCARATESGARLAWTADDFLLEHEVGPWTELPFWAPDQLGHGRSLVGVHGPRHRRRPALPPAGRHGHRHLGLAARTRTGRRAVPPGKDPARYRRGQGISRAPGPAHPNGPPMTPSGSPSGCARSAREHPGRSVLDSRRAPRCSRTANAAAWPPRSPRSAGSSHGGRRSPAPYPAMAASGTGVSGSAGRDGDR